MNGHVYLRKTDAQIQNSIKKIDVFNIDQKFHNRTVFIGNSLRYLEYHAYSINKIYSQPYYIKLK